MLNTIKKKCQSMVEMAVLGPLMLVALGIAVTYIAKLNGDQYQLMEAFRYALQESHNRNKAVAYGTWDDRRQADASNPIIGQKVTSSGSAAVMWAIPSVEGQGEDPEGQLIVRINQIPYDIQGSSGGIKPMYATITNENVNVNTNDGNINTSRTASVAEAMIYEVGDKQQIPQARGKARAR